MSGGLVLDPASDVLGIVDLQPGFTRDGDRRHFGGRLDHQACAHQIDLHGAIGNGQVFLTHGERSDRKFECHVRAQHGAIADIGDKPAPAFFAEVQALIETPDDPGSNHHLRYRIPKGLYDLPADVTFT